MNTITKLDGIVADLDENEYHAHHAFSSTQAKRILESPARYQHAINNPQQHKTTFDVGHAVHAKVLGVGAPIAVLDFDSYRTKAAQQARDDAYAAGQVPLLAADAAPIDAMAEAVLAHDEARSLLEQPGIPEASVFATCDVTGIDLRARFDYLPNLDATDPIAVDVKTTGTRATQHEFRRSVATYRYDVQQGHYLDTLNLATGRDDYRFRFVVIEKAAPYFVGVLQLDDHFARIGSNAASEARHTLRTCLDTDTWPTGLEDVAWVDAPFWLDDAEEMSIR